MNDTPDVLEPELLRAYRDLGAPVSPPDGLLTSVRRGIRRRRAVRGGLATAAVVALTGGVAVQALGGSDGSGDRVAADPGGTATSTLTFTRTDGSTYTFGAGDLEVTCPVPGPESDGRQHLVLSRKDRVQPVLYVDLLVDKVAHDKVFDLPYDVGGGTDKLPMIFFFTSTEGDDANELASNMPGSSGTVTVHEASCGPAPSLWIEIDGVLGSEVEQPALAIEGEYRS